MRRALSLLLCLLALAAFFPSACAVGVADASRMAAVTEVVEEGMTPVYAGSLVDGDYPIEVESSSSMFSIVSAVLHVRGDNLTATMTMGGKGYLYVYPGTATEAAQGEESAYIPFAEDESGAHTFTIPVEALDAPVPCAAFSKNKELWYDRSLLFRADSLPMEAFREGFFTTAESLGLGAGSYTVPVTLSGGSGRASVESPARLTVKDGACTAEIVWSSKNYDYMRVGEETYFPVNTEGNSTFVIPVLFFDRPMAVAADTIAMGEPHEIAYTLRFDAAGIEAAEPESGIAGPMELAYAENFTVELCPGGAYRLRIGEDQDCLLLPENAEIPEGLESLPRIPIPAEKIYLASSSAPDLFRQADALDAVGFSSTAPENWHIPELKEALEEERILYAGKYSVPDYELLLTEGCDLAVENTMILHSPAVREKLETLGIPVLVEYSSYEPHPLGRVEWIKLYGLLTGRLPEAEAFFERQLETFRGIENAEPLGKSVAFFHVTQSGGVTVRQQADYITRMIELAGGETAVTGLPEADNALSTVTIQMESFYTQARDADVLIYNSTAAAQLRDLDELLALSPLFEDFKAVREGHVWCTEKSMFQRSSAAADIITELRAVLKGGGGEELQYFHTLS